MRNRHSAMSIEWAETGKPVQVLRSNGVWRDVERPAWLEEFDYRFKPEVVRYRLYRMDYSPYPGVVSTEEAARNAEQDGSFLMWLGGWQEVEV